MHFSAGKLNPTLFPRSVSPKSVPKNAGAAPKGVFLDEKVVRGRFTALLSAVPSRGNGRSAAARRIGGLCWVSVVRVMRRGSLSRLSFVRLGRAPKDADAWCG